MRWSDRQLAMLEAMGLRLWLPPTSAQDEAGMPGADLVGDQEGRGVELDAAAVAVAVAPRLLPSRPQIAPLPAAREGDRFGSGAEYAGDGSRSDAGPGSVSTMDWPTLQGMVAGCTACKLSQSRRQTVFGVGHPRAHWMIVGEAPGEQEDRLGEPFVGKSGQLLDNMLRSIGLGRAPTDPRAAGPAGPTDPDAGDPARQVYICNTIKCRPPGNRNPDAEELARCEGYLVRQVELVQPRIILAMGRVAVQSLLRSTEPVGRLRGRVHHYHGVPLIVTYHPAYLLRNLEDKARAWDDLCLAALTLQSLPVPA